MTNLLSKEILSATYEKAPVAIVICAADASWISSNPATTLLTGYSEAEIVDMTKREILRVSDKQSIYYQVQDLMSGKIEVFDIATKYRLKNNDIKWMKISIAKASAPDETPFLIAVLEDIDASFSAKVELERKLNEVVKLNELMVNRELRMIELKGEIKELSGGNS